jgi:malate synthase
MALTVTDTKPVAGAEKILTPGALDFVEKLHAKFAATRGGLLAERATARQQASAAGTLDFLPETRRIREGDWQVAPAPAKLQDRRVEMTGPASPVKMAINALNSGAKGLAGRPRGRQRPDLAQRH